MTSKKCHHLTTMLSFEGDDPETTSSDDNAGLLPYTQRDLGCVDPAARYDQMQTIRFRQFSYNGPDLDTARYLNKSDPTDELTDEDIESQLTNWREFRLVTGYQLPLMRYTTACVARMSFAFECGCPRPPWSFGVNLDDWVAEQIGNVRNRPDYPWDRNKMHLWSEMQSRSETRLAPDPILDWHPTMVNDTKNVTDNLQRCSSAYCELRRSSLFTSTIYWERDYLKACRQMVDEDAQRTQNWKDTEECISLVNVQSAHDDYLSFLVTGLSNKRGTLVNAYHWANGTSAQLDACLPFAHKVDYGFVLLDFMSLVAETCPPGAFGLQSALNDAFHLIVHLANNDLFPMGVAQCELLSNVQSGLYNIGKAVCDFIHEPSTNRFVPSQFNQPSVRHGRERDPNVLLFICLFFVDEHQAFKVLQLEGENCEFLVKRCTYLCNTMASYGEHTLSRWHWPKFYVDEAPKYRSAMNDRRVFRTNTNPCMQYDPVELVTTVEQLFARDMIPKKDEQRLECRDKDCIKSVRFHPTRETECRMSRDTNFVQYAQGARKSDNVTLGELKDIMEFMPTASFAKPSSSG